MSDTVPAKAVKFDLAAAGLGEKRISFQGDATCHLLIFQDLV